MEIVKNENQKNGNQEKRKLKNWILGKMIFVENGNQRKFKVENKKNENVKLGEREIRQIGNLEERDIGKMDIGKKRNWVEE